ncbi:MAG TPA: GlsB/YeaQ/YmgE family stress response membrane protein [Acidimicrobiales bacterium]|nr:GlsB/YeaQ/YmgE family stress response membrane protein [Acidimicrobiales bacterium]
MVLDVLGYIFFGFVVGALARFVLPGRRPMGCAATIIAGLLGSFIAGLIIRAVTGQNRGAGWIASILGAMLVVWLYTRSQRSQYY